MCSLTPACKKWPLAPILPKEYRIYTFFDNWSYSFQKYIAPHPLSKRVLGLDHAFWKLLQHLDTNFENVPHLGPTLLPQPCAASGSHPAASTCDTCSILCCKRTASGSQVTFWDFFGQKSDFLRFFTLGFLVQIYCKQVPPDIKVTFWDFLGHKSDFLKFFGCPHYFLPYPFWLFEILVDIKVTFWDFLGFFWTYTCHFIALLNVFCTCSFLFLLYILLFYVIFSVQVWFMKEKFWI